MSVAFPPSTAGEIAAAIASGKVTARDVVEAALARIGIIDPKVNAFTDVTAERARTRAAVLDRRIAAGEKPGPLAGTPFAVKNLIDVEGLPTRAGSKINRERAPAARRCFGSAPRGSWRDPRRHPQHGRIRL